MKVFYDKRQAVIGQVSSSPSPNKPPIVLKEWRRLGLPVEVSSFKPLTTKEICSAHDPIYVVGVLAGKHTNGFGNTIEAVAKSLPYTTGSFAAAAVYAAETGKNAASLTSGFHHSCYESGGAYCTFNGLVIAAQLLKSKGLVEKVGILDCDAHYGNGTEEIIRHLGIKHIEHWTFGGHSIGPKTADFWLDNLADLIEDKFSGCNVLLYQAGADPFIDDPLGGYLTKAQLKRRDRIVFETCKRLGIPVAWNLAGGYTYKFQDVLDIHSNTAIECIRVEKGKKNGQRIQTKKAKRTTRTSTKRHSKRSRRSQGKSGKKR